MKTLKFIFAVIWQLPQSLIGWIMILFFRIIGNVRLITRYKWCYIFEAEHMNGAISLGTIIICSPVSAKRQATIQHEIGHAERSLRIGWLYLIVIGLPSLLWACFHEYLGFTNYYIFYTEADANKLGYVKVIERNGYCYLECIKNIL